jgi:ZIP family zinc transporter
MAIVIAFGTFVFTMLGGLFALHWRRRLFVVMALAAGILVAAALTDLLPEAVEMAGDGGIDRVLLAALVGFLVFYALDRFVHRAAAGHIRYLPASAFGSVAALGLTIHSFLDGFAIGSAFQVDAAVGLVVAIAVLTHDFGDGVATVSVVLGSRGRLRASFGWLVADALAPVVGAAIALVVSFSPTTLALLLGFFAGSFLFIGAAHLLPEAQREGPDVACTAAFIAGCAIIVFATRVLHA